MTKRRNTIKYENKPNDQSMIRAYLETFAKMNEKELEALCGAIGIESGTIDSLVSDMTSMANEVLSENSTIQGILDGYRNYLVSLARPGIEDALDLAPLGSAIVQAGRTREYLYADDPEGALLSLLSGIMSTGTARTEIVTIINKNSLEMLELQLHHTTQFMVLTEQSRAKRMSGLNDIIQRKKSAQSFAENYARQLWRSDDGHKLRTGSMVGLVREHLRQTGYADVLPELDDSLKSWISGTIPRYAKRPGRPPKKKK